MQHQFAAFIDDLKTTHGKNLASVILYGVKSVTFLGEVDGHGEDRHSLSQYSDAPHRGALLHEAEGGGAGTQQQTLLPDYPSPARE